MRTGRVRAVISHLVSPGWRGGRPAPQRELQRPGEGAKRFLIPDVAAEIVYGRRIEAPAQTPEMR